MKLGKTALRLVYPQWQGGIISHLVPELSTEDASQGYSLGAKLLNFLARNNEQKTVEVPISMDTNKIETEKGIRAREAIVKQTKDALDLIHENNPERIVTLGGECSVSIVPFTYLKAKYKNDIAIVGSMHIPISLFQGTPMKGTMRWHLQLVWEWVTTKL